jgi:hypothetical protein
MPPGWRTGKVAAAACLAGAASVVVATEEPGTLPGSFIPRLPLRTDDGPLRFRELSTLSGGTIDFGSPKSDVEKCTCAFFDADGDGWDDLLSLAGVGQGWRYFLNRDDGAGGRTFVPAPPGNGLDSGAPMQRDGAGLAVADVDGDGDEDVYVGCGWNRNLPTGSGRNLLLLNDGAGNFTDVAPEKGLADGDNTTCGMVLFDMDLDGDLDLLSCNTDFQNAGKEGDGLTHLFRNALAETGAFVFVEETAERKIAENGKAVWAAIATDYDADGDPDLLISHDIEGPTQLFANDGKGYFTEVTGVVGAGEGDDATPSTFGDDTSQAMGAAVADIENDGDFDLVISDAPRQCLYENIGGGKYAMRDHTHGFDARTVGWGTSFADFDLDGWIDLYLAAGDFWNTDRNDVRAWLYRNCGNGTFEDVWAGSGIRHDAPLHRQNGTATADFDRDGRPDLLITRAHRAGASPYLYRNESTTLGRRWLQVRLAGSGVTSNTSAIGAKLRVHPRDAAGARIAGLSQLREIASSDSRSSRSSLTQHVGLGPDAVSADVEVEWPRAGDLASRRALYEDVPLDRVVRIEELPREAPWRLAPTVQIVVPDDSDAVVPCAGEGPADPLTTLLVESGPAWLSAGPWQEGRTLRIAPPRVEAPETSVATLVATAQGAAEPESRQTLEVRVVPAPRVRRVDVLGGRTLRVVGDHLDVPGLAFTLDGVPCEVRRVVDRTRPPAAAPTRAMVRFPASLRKAVRAGGAVLRVVEPVAGFEATEEL